MNNPEPIKTKLTEAIEQENSKYLAVWRDYTRAQKRSLSVKYNGRTMKALAYIELISKKLPELIDVETNKPMNHRANLSAIFMDVGEIGLNSYTETVRATFLALVKNLEMQRQQEIKTAKLKQQSEESNEQ